MHDARWSPGCHLPYFRNLVHSEKIVNLASSGSRSQRISILHEQNLGNGLRFTLLHADCTGRPDLAYDLYVLLPAKYTASQHRIRWVFGNSLAVSCGIYSLVTCFCCSS